MTIKTFRDLLEALPKLNSDQLNCDLILYSALTDEMFYRAELKIADGKEYDVVDDKHPYLVLDFEGDNEADD
jgi:hypothetical protein